MSTRENVGFRRAAAVAVLLHALFLSAPLVVPPPSPWLAHSQKPELELELEVGVELAPSSGDSSGSPAPAPLARVEPRRTRKTADLLPQSSREPSGPAATEPGSEPTASGREASRPESVPLSPDALGLGRSSALWVMPETKAPDPAASAARRVDRSLAEGLAEHDRKLGLGSDGPVLSALERATYSSGLPGNGSALFVARIDSSGKLSLIDVVEVNGDHAGWASVARRALGTLAKHKLRVPSGSRGIELKIRITSREALPSGADPGLEVRALGLPLKKGRGKRSAKISILEPRASVKMADVPQPGNKTIRMPVPDVGLGVLGVHGDPSDIGAKPRRIVHARVESQSVL